MNQRRRPLAKHSEAQKGYREAETGEDVTRQNVHAMRQLEEAAMAKRTRADRVAAAIARFCGSMHFAWIHVVLFSMWIRVGGSAAARACKVVSAGRKVTAAVLPPALQVASQTRWHRR